MAIPCQKSCLPESCESRRLKTKILTDSLNHPNKLGKVGRHISILVRPTTLHRRVVRVFALDDVGLYRNWAALRRMVELK
jgi:hypothetical protein